MYKRQVNVRSLVTTAGIATAWPASVGKGFDARVFWRHCLGVASCAESLARHARLRPETLFLAGLLHDIGRLVLVATYPEAFAEMCIRDRLLSLLLAVLAKMLVESRAHERDLEALSLIHI